MSDQEFYQRYAGFSHRELYTMLQAGDPGQVDDVAAAWSMLQQTAADLAAALGADLTRLAPAWSGPAGAEYQARVGIVGSFSTALGEDFDAVCQTLTAIAGRLREARAQAEDPAHVDTGHMAHDAVTGAAWGAVIGPFGVALGGTIGAAHGHEIDEQEKQKAHQRMVNLVAGLAADYAPVASVAWSTPPQSPPPGLPTGAAAGEMAIGRAMVGSGLSGVGTPHGTGHADLERVEPAAVVTAMPRAGAAGEPTGSGGSGGGHVSETAQASAGTALLGAGVIDAVAVDVALRGMGRPPQYLVSPTGGTSATGPAESIGGEEVPAAKAASMTGPPPAEEAEHAGMAGRGHDPEDDVDEHLTWLTEDDMAWGGHQPTAPPVVGGQKPPESGPVPTDDA